MIRQERLKPHTNPAGTITYSSFLQKRLYNTVRIPGERMDTIKSYFKPLSLGGSPTHIIFLGRGRIFTVKGTNDDGSIISVQACYVNLLQIRALMNEHDDVHLPVPILTHDNRTGWAQVCLQKCLAKFFIDKLQLLLILNCRIENI